MAIDFSEKLSGLLVPVFALRRNQDMGIGDTESVLDAIEWCRRMGIGVLQTLPINETGGDHSPYNAISSVALDPVYIAINNKHVPGLTDSMIERFAEDIENLRKGNGPVDYPKVKQLKIKLLTLAYQNFVKTELNPIPSTGGKSFRAFQLKNRAWLPAYSLFRTLVEWHKGNACWTRWPAEHQNPDITRRWIEKSPEKNSLLERVDFFCYVQWIAFKQWESIKKAATKAHVKLMGDIPFGVSRYSADVWAERHLFDLTWSGGAPPETFFQTDPFTAKWGQNWGIPVYDWVAHTRNRFNWWKQRVRQTMRVFHLFRIDHVLGFFRIYSFPWNPERNMEFLDLTPEQAAAKTEGRLPRFLPGPDEPGASAAINATQGEKILGIILAAAGKNGGVVAEDLGMVPPYVRPILQKLNIPGFSIPLFERDPKTGEYVKTDAFPIKSITTHATHDHMPIRSFYEDLVRKWHGPNGHESWLEVQRLMRLLELPDTNPPKEFTKELHLAFLRTLDKSSSWLAMNQITEILGTSQRFNMPGSLSSSNWSERLDRPLHLYNSDPYYGPLLGEIKKQSQALRKTAATSS